MNQSVVALVVTFNRKAYLEKVLDSLANQSYPIEKIIIVDNNSADGTADLVAEVKLKCPEIEYYNTGANLGGAGGFHFGFQKIMDLSYDFLWLMDDDLLPENDCLNNLIVNGTGDIRQPLRFNLDGSCAELSPIKFDLKSRFIIRPKRLSVKDVVDSNTLKNIDIEGIPFEGPLITKQVVDHIGVPNPDFFIFYDDIDYSIRARKEGFRIKCVPAARATRLLVNVQSDDLNTWKGYFMLRNLFYILREYGQNRFVRARPVLITLLYISSLFLKRDWKRINIARAAFRDSYKLENSENYKP